MSFVFICIQNGDSLSEVWSMNSWWLYKIEWCKRTCESPFSKLVQAKKEVRYRSARIPAYGLKLSQSIDSFRFIKYSSGNDRAHEFQGCFLNHKYIHD